MKKKQNKTKKKKKQKKKERAYFYFFISFDDDDAFFPSFFLLIFSSVSLLIFPFPFKAFSYDYQNYINSNLSSYHLNQKTNPRYHWILKIPFLFYLILSSSFFYL